MLTYRVKLDIDGPPGMRTDDLQQSLLTGSTSNTRAIYTTMLTSMFTLMKNRVVTFKPEVLLHSYRYLLVFFIFVLFVVDSSFKRVRRVVEFLKHCSVLSV